MTDTQRLNKRSIRRIQELMFIPIMGFDLKQIESFDMHVDIVRPLPLFIEHPGQMIKGVLYTDRYYLTLYQNELVYLHESVPLT